LCAKIIFYDIVANVCKLFIYEFLLLNALLKRSQSFTLPTKIDLYTCGKESKKAGDLRCSDDNATMYKQCWSRQIYYQLLCISTFCTQNVQVVNLYCAILIDEEAQATLMRPNFFEKHQISHFSFQKFNTSSSTLYFFFCLIAINGFGEQHTI
jgi:hypothetical protein